MRAAGLRIWIVVHKWTSLICTVILLLLCITGLPLIFKDEIQAWLDRSYITQGAAPGGSEASLDQVAAAALERHPGSFIQSLYWDEHIANVIRLSLANEPDAPVGEWRWISLDRRSGGVLDDAPQESPALAFLLLVHKELLLGLPGSLVLCAIGLVFLASLISGVVIYAPFVHKLTFGAARRHRGSRLAWLDLHNLFGIVTAAWVLVVGATGVINTLTIPMFDYWEADEIPDLLAPYEGQPLPTSLASVQAAVDTARAAAPGNQVFSVVFPRTDQGSPRHYLIWTHGSTPLTAELFTPVLVDAETAADAQPRALPWYLRTLELSRPLHFGDYGDWPLKVLWALFDMIAIVVLVSGLVLWRARRRNDFASVVLSGAPDE